MDLIVVRRSIDPNYILVEKKDTTMDLIATLARITELNYREE